VRRALLLASLFALSLLLWPSDDGPAGAQGPEQVFVTNFPELQRVRGDVVVRAPVPHTRLATSKALVSPAALADTTSYTEAGVLDAEGFGAVSLGIAGVVQGRLMAPAPIGVVLLPDEPELVAAFRTHGVAPFALRVDAVATPSESGIFHSPTVRVELAFPRYRVLFYNATPRTSEVTLYAYLKSS
jgi:hypothetical protein